MLTTLIPLFDGDMTVKAYSVFSRKTNQFLNPLAMSTGVNDGATTVPGLDIIQAMGLRTIGTDTEVFVPVSNVSIFSDIAGQIGSEPHDRIVILIDRTIPPVEMYANRIKELKEQGFKFAIRKLSVTEFTDYAPILAQMDYVFLNNKKIAIDKARIYFEKLYPNAKLVAGNIESQEVFSALKEEGGYQFYEGEFYRVPLTRGTHEISPVKTTYLSLLRVVNSDDFELTEAADVVGRDPALTVSFLKMINRVVKTSQITSVRHAAAMLGQKEMKKWINTAVTEELYSDKPGEITRLSLLRARFAENLAELFGLKMQTEELFLMGLFSVLDVILDKPMEEALEMIQVSNVIRDALVYKKGVLAPVLEFILGYESADWSEIDRQMVLSGMDGDKIYEAYRESLSWYKTTIVGE
ncbi:MAG: HDOD domain-containing protein [Lachnospiraceae bacterium]|nr:HDOD domain-containing protein [Candidatus Merdinaster equi]